MSLSEFQKMPRNLPASVKTNPKVTTKDIWMSYANQLKVRKENNADITWHFAIAGQ